MPGLIPESATVKGPQGVPRADLKAWPRLPLQLCQGVWWALSILVRRKPLGAASALILCGLVVVAILAPVLAPYDPYKFNLNERALPIRMQPPGFHLRRDRRWSLTYSEELVSSKISATLQSTDRHHGIVGQEHCHFQRDA